MKEVRGDPNMTMVKAPFTAAQVECLKKWQAMEMPFTCRNEAHRRDDQGAKIPLVPTKEGFHCANPECDYTQDSAHEFMLTYDPPKSTI